MRQDFIFQVPAPPQPFLTRRSHATLVLHADEIDGTPDGKDAAGNLDLRGHISFTIDQTQNGIKRHISGTAGHAKMRRAEGRIKLTEIVHVSLSDSSTLAEPAVVTGENAIVDLKAAPYSITVDGSEQASNVLFVPRSKSDSDAIQRIHVSQFSHGEFQPGIAGAFTGKQVRAEVFSPSSGNSAVLYSSRIAAEYDHEMLEAIRSQVPVTYHAEQRLASGVIGQSADGSAQAAELRVPGRFLLLTGGSKSRLYNADNLVGPGTLVSKTARLDLSATPYRYTADGPADVTSLHFVLSPTASSKQGPTTVHIFGYLHMSRATEQTVEFTGPYTTLDLSRETPKALSHVTCSKLTIRLGPGNKSIQQVTADDHVHYRFTTAITASQDRTMSGTADNVVVALPPPSAGRATRNSLQKLSMHNVRGTLISPDRLNGEATIRADDVEEITEGGQTQITATGDPANTDLVAPLRAGSTAFDVGQSPTATNTMHLYRFQRAQLNKDGSLSESGIRSVLDLNQTHEKRISHILSNQIDVSVDPKTKSPLVATAVGHVTISSEEPLLDKSGKAAGQQPAQIRRLEASCDRAIYRITLQEVALDGGVTGRLTDKTLFVEPCAIRADSMTIGLQSPFSTLELHDALRAGQPRSTDVRMGLLMKPTSAGAIPKTKSSQKPATASNMFMRVHLYGFTRCPN